MSRRALRCLGACLLIGCAAPQDENPAPRCVTVVDCPSELMCYRGFCVEPDVIVPDEPSWSGGDAAVGANEASTPSAVGGNVGGTSSSSDGAVAPAPTSTNGGAAQVRDAGTVPQPTSASSGSTPESAAPTSTAPVANPSPTAPVVTPPAAAPSTPPQQPAQPQQQPEQPKPEQPKPAPAQPAMPQNGGPLGELIKDGLAPETMIVCVPICILGLNKDCEQCIDRVLKSQPGGTGCAEKAGSKTGGKEDDKEDAEDEEEDGKGDDEVPVVCSLVKCAEGACRSDP